MSFLLLLCLVFNKIREEGRTGYGVWGEGGGRGQGREMAQTMYAHTNKLIKKKNPRALLELGWLFTVIF
jgi:hypothetical protein